MSGRVVEGMLIMYTPLNTLEQAEHGGLGIFSVADGADLKQTLQSPGRAAGGE